MGPLSLNLDITDAKTSVPMFSDGSLVEFELKTIAEKPNEKGPALEFVFESVNPAPNTDGGTILPGQLGSKVFKTLYGYQKDGDSAKAQARMAQDIARIVDACLGTGDRGNIKGKPERPGVNEALAACIGKHIVAKIKNETGDFQRSGLGTLYYPPDLAK